MTDRPLLKTVWPALRRGGGQVQFGTSPGHAVVVEGLTEDQIEALEALDGTRALPAALADPAAGGLLALLREQGLVIDTEAPAIPVPLRSVLALEAEALSRTPGTVPAGYAALAGRRAARVLVDGRGALPTAIAALLRRAGVHEVAVGEDAVPDWEHRADSGARRDRSAPAPALVVLVAPQALDSAAGESWRRRGIPVLPVVLHAVEAVVGPLVTRDGPCLRCLDLTRADLDRAWPALLGQLTRHGVGHSREASGGASLVALAAAMAATAGLAVLDGHAVPPGRSLEVALPWPRTRERQWAPHPRCHCQATRPGTGVKTGAETEPAQQAHVAHPAHPSPGFGGAAHAGPPPEARMAG